MTLEQVSLMWICACVALAALVAATQPAAVHEARQGPGPVSLQTSSSTSEKTTMSPTSSSERSSSSSVSPSSLTTSSNIQSHSSEASSEATTSSGTSSATPQSSSSPGSLNFNVHNMTTCTSGLISWSYTGQAAELSLSITNIGVDQSYDLSRFRARQSVSGTIQKQLVDTNTSASSWTWSSVNLTQGWYEIQGLVIATPSVSSNSAPFFITNGTNVSCLTSTSPQASSTLSPSASASSSTAAAKTNVASIVGGVVGGVVGAILVVIAGVWLWSRRRKRSFARGGSRRQKWGSLKSTHSSIQPGGDGAKPAGDHFHGHSESTEGVLEVVGGGKGSATTTSGDSEEDPAIMGEEKPISPASSSGMSPFDALNTPIHYDRRASTYYPQIPTPVASEGFRTRSASGHASNQSIEQQAQRIRSSMETSIRRRSDRLSMPTLPSPSLSRLPHSPTHTQHKEEYPLSPVTATPINRSISTGGVIARRTSRKPVPEYDPSALFEDTNTDSVSTFTGGAESSQTHGTGMGTGASGTPTDLVHKASFGDGRPVHYLIPDMPLPQRD